MHYAGEPTRRSSRLRRDLRLPSYRNINAWIQDSGFDISLPHPWQTDHINSNRYVFALDTSLKKCLELSRVCISQITFYGSLTCSLKCDYGHIMFVVRVPQYATMSWSQFNIDPEIDRQKLSRQENQDMTLIQAERDLKTTRNIKTAVVHISINLRESRSKHKNHKKTQESINRTCTASSRKCEASKHCLLIVEACNKNCLYDQIV